MNTTIEALGRTDAGLSAEEAARRLAADGPNSVARPRPRPLVGRVVAQLIEPLVALLLAAFVVTVLLGDAADAAVIALVVIVNTAIGVTQEVRAEQAIAALDELSAPTARVVRDGLDLVVPASTVVSGDVVRVEAGDIVPADLRLRTAHALSTDEAALTGESQAVSHEAGDELLAGTVVVTGRARGTVLRIGADSALGRIAALVAATKTGPTPLQRRLSSLGRILGGAIVVLCAVVFLLGVLAGQPAITMAITAVSLVVAAVPESLPAVVTLALALGARRMAEQRAIPRRLHAVETLGSATVIASDKTGTLTEGRMAVRRVVDADGAVCDVHGHGYEPVGELHGGDRPATAPPLDLARAALLCNDAALAPPDHEHADWRPVGDPMEAALVTFAARCGLDPATERRATPRLAERPFDQGSRRMTTLHRRPSGELLVICKGAPESVLASPLVTDDVGPARAAAAELTAAGLRVLAIAAAVLPADAPAPDLDAPAGLSIVGVVGIGDPVRASATDTARALEKAGVRLILITGDHPATATSIAAQVGIWRDGDEVVVGGLPSGAAGLDATRVYARTQPAHKLEIIAALQERGEVVAMTGDGVNDAPALRRADIGVAMGSGTEVARQAADLVLLDDNLATVTTAIGEGRRVYDNIRRFLHYGLAGGVAELLVMLVGPFLGLTVPLLAGQILWVNLLTHGVPGVAMGAEPAEPDVLERAPRSPQESVLGGGLDRSVLGTGIGLTAAVLAAGLAAQALGWPWQSVVFVVLGLAQLGIAVAVRARRYPGGGRNRALALAIALSATLQVAGVAVGPLRRLLGTEPLSVVQLGACAVVAVLPALALTTTRWLAARRTGDRAGALGR